MSFRIGRIWGFPIEIHLSWFIILVLVVWTFSVGLFPHIQALAGLPAWQYWAMGVVTALFFFLSVLIHELAHSYVAIRNGMGIGGITLFVFGGVSKITEEPRTAELELKMAIAGPLMSLVLGGVFWGIGFAAQAALAPVQVVAVASYLGTINLILGVFNLIPGFPLDGGRVFRAIVWHYTHDLVRSSRYASLLGQGVGYAFMLWGVFQLLGGFALNGIWIALIGFFIVGAAQNAYQQVLVQRALAGMPVERVMQRDVPRVDPGISLRDVVDHYFIGHDYNAYPVVQNDNLVGVVTADDVRQVPRDQWYETKVGDVTRRVDARALVDENEDAWDALSKMLNNDAGRMLVVHEGHLEGILTRDSIMNVVRTKLQLGT